MNSEEDLDANDFYGDYTPRANATTTVDEDLEADDGDETALSENINTAPSQLHQYSLHDDVRANPAWPLSYGSVLNFLSINIV